MRMREKSLEASQGLMLCKRLRALHNLKLKFFASFGGVGILLVSKSGSFLAGHASETLPFLVVAILDALAAIWALVAWWRLYDAGI